MPSAVQADQIQTLSEGLSKQCMRLPNLRAEFAGWPFEVNPHLEELRPIVDEMIQRFVGLQASRDCLSDMVSASCPTSASSKD